MIFGKTQNFSQTFAVRGKRNALNYLWLMLNDMGEVS